MICESKRTHINNNAIYLEFSWKLIRPSTNVVNMRIPNICPDKSILFDFFLISCIINIVC